MTRSLPLLPDIAFDFDLEHGRCLAVRLPDAESSVDALAEATLAPEELAFAASLAPMRRRTWVGGRVAMRQALARASLDAPPLLSDARGAPMMPSSIAGSISHKERLAVALVAKGTARVGVDLEVDVTRARDIASRVLTNDELSDLAALEGEAYGRELLLRFSAKEAIYKALDPFVRRYVGFKEVTVKPRPEGDADVRLQLPASDGLFLVDVRWLRWEGYVLTTARAIRRET